MVDIVAFLVAQMVESACSVGDMGLILGSGRPPGEENGYPSQYSCLENPIDRGAWQATVHGAAKEVDMTSQLTTTTICVVLIMRGRKEWVLLVSSRQRLRMLPNILQCTRNLSPLNTNYLALNVE